MLYDPKWEKPARSLAGFVAWLELQPANKQYCPVSPNVCALAQYLGGFCNPSDEGAIIGGDGDIIFGHPRTFGGVLERARSALSAGEGR